MCYHSLNVLLTKSNDGGGGVIEKSGKRGNKFGQWGTVEGCAWLGSVSSEGCEEEDRS